MMLDAPLVVLINEMLARAMWPGQDPIGRGLLIETEAPARVVGVVGDIRSSGPDAP
jgi:hypothetical protein